MGGGIQGQIRVAYLCLVHAKVYARNASSSIFFGMFPTCAVVEEIDMRSRLRVVGSVRGITYMVMEKSSKIGSPRRGLESACKVGFGMGNGKVTKQREEWRL